MPVRPSHTAPPALRGTRPPTRSVHRRLRLAALAGLALLPLAAAASAPVPSFRGLGDLPGGLFSSQAWGVSADGSVVVGHSRSALGLEAFRWQGGVMTGLGDLPGGGFESWASDVSADGSVVVGSSRSALGLEAFRWQGRVMTGLGDLPGGRVESRATGVSADGSVVVGVGHLHRVPGGFFGSGRDVWGAFRWEGGVMTRLDQMDHASDVSADGSVVVGGRGEGLFGEAVLWRGGVTTGLGDLPGGQVSSFANAVSADGSVVVGRGSSAAGNEAFRWVGGVMTGLGDLPGGIFQSRATGVSADGKVVVGYGLSAAGRRAIFWDEASGMRSLQDVLTVDLGLGAALTGWQLSEATAISDDGLTIVGFGTNPLGNTEAWVATIPEPQTWAMLAAGLGILGWAARRRGLSCASGSRNVGC